MERRAEYVHEPARAGDSQLFAERRYHSAALPTVPEGEADAVLAAADRTIDLLLSSPGKAQSWLHLDGARPTKVERQKNKQDVAVWYELTENLDSTPNGDWKDADYGLSADVMTRFCDTAQELEALRYELTEDMKLWEQDWLDSDFGLSDTQLEEVWRRFSTSLEGADATKMVRDADIGAPCPAALQDVERTVNRTELQQLTDFIGEQTLGQFIGEELSAVVPGSLRARVLSIREVRGQAFILIQVNELGAERFFLKALADIQELQASLVPTVATRSLPTAPVGDILGFQRWMLGSAFDAQRTLQLRSYVDAVLAAALAPSQVRALTAFLGAGAAGRVGRPSGKRQVALKWCTVSPWASARAL